MPRVVLAGLIAGGHSGVPRYAAELIMAIDRAAADFPELDLELLLTPAGQRAAPTERLPVRIVGGRVPRIESGPVRLLVEQLAAPLARAELIHYFDLVGPLLAPWRRFTATSHDAKVVQEPSGFTRLQRAYKRTAIPLVVRRAACIIAPSETIRDQTVTYFGADPARVEVVLSGPGLGRVTSAQEQRSREPIILYVGSLSSVKNVHFLVEAFDAADAPARLVLVGRPGPGYDLLADAIARARLHDRVEVHTTATDAEVDGLYRRALALALPSRHEGFGFPALEAMGRECPVIASDIPAIREISGDGCMLLPLDDQAAWAAGIRRIVADADLRRSLAERGRTRVSRYSWDETARGTLRILSREAASVRARA